MFTTFSLLKSQEVNADEKRQFWRLLETYSKTDAGNWMNDFQWRAFIINWCPAMLDSDGVMGAYVPWLGNKVFLLPSDSPVVAGREDYWPGLIASTLVHELRHAWQYRRNPILYVICCLPVLREFTLERDAWAITKPAEDFFAELDNLHASQKFEEWHAKRKEVTP